MGVITKNVWDYDEDQPGGILMTAKPDPQAYGLSITVPDDAAKNALNPLDFLESTMLIVESTKTLWGQVDGAFVRIGGSSPTPNDHPPAYIGPRTDNTIDAKFGHVARGTTGEGYLARNDGNLFISPAWGGYVGLYDVSSGDFGRLQYTYSRLNSIGLGQHPSHGGQWDGIWSEYTRNNVYGSDYILLKNRASGQLLLNSQNAAMEMRINNAGRMTIDGSQTWVAGNFTANQGTASFNVCNANSMYAAGDISTSKHYYQQGGDPATGWNDAHYVVAGAGYNGARVGLNYGGAAMQMRCGQWKGEAMEFIAGDASVYRWIYASAFQVDSTIKSKKDVRSITVQTDRPKVEHDQWLDTVPDLDIMSLRPVAFRPAHVAQAVDPDTLEFVPQTQPVQLHQDTRERLGLIAEEVATVIPSAVGHNMDGTAGGIDYAQVTVALLGHVQQLTATIETLKYRIAELENANERSVNQ